MATNTLAYLTLKKMSIQMRNSASTPNAITLSMIIAMPQEVSNSPRNPSTIQSSSSEMENGDLVNKIYMTIFETASKTHSGC